MSSALQSALGGATRAYIPYAWEALPNLVNLTVDDAWWMDSVTSQRMAMDLIGSTGAQGIAADVVHVHQWKQLMESDNVDDLLDDIMGEDSVMGAMASFGNFVLTVPLPVLGVLPEIQSLVDRLDEDYLGDALCDLAREAMGTGLAGLVVLGERSDSELLPRVVRLAENFDCPIFLPGPSGSNSANPGIASEWHAGRSGPDGHVSVDGASTSGVILTPGDVSAVWNREEIAQFAGR